MAKQTGLLKYSGNLGGISHYKMKGVKGDLAKVANGPSKEQIATDPKFKRTRENNAEFGVSAKAGKSMRVGLASVIKNFADPQVVGRITKVFKAINLEGVGDRGKRPIDISLNKNHLIGFEFDKITSFSTIFTAPFSCSENAARNESTLTIPSFVPLDYINAPAGATHFRILNGITVLSDVRWNNTSKTYEVVEPDMDTINILEYSNYLPIDSTIAGNTTIVAALPGAPTMSVDVSALNVIGIEFYQEVNGAYYLFASGNAMKVGNVF
jgi:hypothetical protein